MLRIAEKVVWLAFLDDLTGIHWNQAGRPEQPSHSRYGCAGGCMGTFPEVRLFHQSDQLFVKR